MKKLLNLKALITGASSGLGQEIASAFSKEGADIVFGYFRNEKGAKNTIEKIEKNNRKGYALRANLEDPTSSTYLAQEAYKILGKLDILINNAGIHIPFSNFIDISLEALEKINSVNFISPFLLIQEAARIMKNQPEGGNIINISSMSTHFLSPGSTHYECSKAAIDSLTKGAAYDLGKYNIRVNGIAAGSIATSINEKQRLKDPEEWIIRQKKTPLMKEGFPQDVAQACVYLCSKDANWITGTTLVIDGGAHLMNPFRK